MLATLLTLALAASSTPLCDFEQPLALQIGGEGVQPGSTVNVATGHAHGGTRAACVHYSFIAEPKGLQYVGFGADLLMPLRLAKFHAWVLGDGSGNAINVRLVDASGETHQFQLGRAGFVGWRKLSAPISDRGLSWGGDNNGRLDPPLRLGLLLVDSQRRQAEGDIWFDDLSYELEESTDPDWALPLTPPGPARLEGENLKPGTRLAAGAPGHWDLAYQFDGGAAPEHALIRLDAPVPRADALAVWATGDGKGQILRFQLRDAGGETHQITFGPILWAGARRCEVPVRATEHWGGDNNGQLDLPLTLSNLVVDRGAAPAKGALAFEGLTAVPSRGAPRALRLSAESCDGTTPGVGGEQVQPASKLVRDTATMHGGAASWRLDYTFAQVAGLEYLEIPTPCPLGAQPGPLSVWVKGDGSGSPLRLRLTEVGGECHQFDLGKLDFTDWRQLSTDFSGPHGHWLGDDNGKFDGELRLSSLLLDSGTRPSTGSVWIDDVVVSTTARAADTVRPSFTDGKSGGIYGPGEPVSLEVAWRSLQVPGDQPAELPVTIKLRGPGGQPLRTIEQTVPLADGAGTEALPVADLARGTGIYEATLIWRVADDFATEQRSFCRLPDVGETDVDTNPFGACLHYAQHKGQVPLNFELLQRGGGRWARDEYSWGVVEQKPGVYTFPEWNEAYMRAARAQRIRPFIIFDYTNALYDKGESPTSDAAQEAFAKYSAALVERYRDVCHDWEVYNEPNIGFWHPKPDAVVYTRLLKRTYAAVKQADPTCTVAGICTAGIDFGYIETVLREGGGPFMDVLSVHPYRYPGSPEATGFVDDLNRLHALMEKYGIGGMPVWITEIGWPNHVTGGGSTEQHSAECLVRMVCLARSLPFMGPVMWYDFQDDGWDPKYNEANFGLVRPDYSPKRPYMAAAVMARALAGKRFVRWVVDQPPLYVQEYEGAGGERALVLWSTPSETRVTLRLEGGPVHGLATIDGAEGPLTAGTLTVGEAPLFVTGRYKTAQVLPEQR
ncbi:MAG: hypothetical protein HYU66_05670 [Armatimonadetes bacterium]|nr:hypothetical protein [Armatimonadota bacterium]